MYVWFVYMYLHVGVVCKRLCVCVLLVCVLYVSMRDRAQIERTEEGEER